MLIKKVSKEALVFMGIIVIAVFFRFYQLDSLPPGLWPDEAANGVDALKTLDQCQGVSTYQCLKNLKIFYPANNGREGLFINIQAFSIKLFGATPFALRVVSAVLGTLTVIGLYLLTKTILNWRIASIASFFMAVSFWHVNFSRIGFRAIMLPLILVWGFYFLWRGLKSGHFREFFITGLIGGIGFYTYFSYRIAPLIGFMVFASYWNHLATHYSGSKYENARNQILRGFALTMLTVIIIALPLMVYFYTNPSEFLKREGRPISVFDQNEPFRELATSVVKTLGMFNFKGDNNLRHNIPGWPELSLPMGVFFAIGFLRELSHLLSRKKGHFSTIHVFLFSWFFIMLLPGFLSTEAPHALRTIGAIPVVMIFAAQGFWWLIELTYRYHRLTDPHFYADKPTYNKESRLLVGITIVVVLVSINFIEYSRYFRDWAKNPGLKEAFTQKYIDISNYLIMNVSNMPQYVLVNDGDVLVDEVPNNAQTIKFLTRTHTQACSLQNNIYYIRSDQLEKLKFSSNFVLIPLKEEPDFVDRFFLEFGLHPKKTGSFVVYTK